jgi:hypothetical protein
VLFLSVPVVAVSTVTGEIDRVVEETTP